MPRRLTAAPHLGLEGIGRRSRAATDPVARSHWQIAWLVASGRSCPEVAAVTGYGADWAREVVGRWNAAGAAAPAGFKKGGSRPSWTG